MAEYIGVAGVQTAGYLAPLQPPDDGKYIDPEKKPAIRSNYPSAFGQNRSRILRVINDVVADNQVETAIIEWEWTGRISLKELGPPLEIGDEPINIFVTGDDRESRQRINADCLSR